MSTQNLHRSARGNNNPRRSRTWCFTSFSEEIPQFNELQMSYLVCGKEVCPTTDKHHWQSFVHFHNAKTREAAQIYIGNVHCDIAKGTDTEAIAYCTKDGEFFEFGVRPQQGRRTDLVLLRDDISAGRSVDDIAVESPMVFHQYGRTLRELEMIHLRTRYRTERTTCDWLFGKTGTGKSYRAFKNFDPKTHYVHCKRDRGWWDGYKGQQIVIINDFRGHICYDDLLEMIDENPWYVPTRGRERLPFVSRHVIITSPLRPEEVYHNRDDNDDIQQLLRRIKIVEMKKIDWLDDSYFCINH